MAEPWSVIYPGPVQTCNVCGRVWWAFKTFTSGILSISNCLYYVQISNPPIFTAFPKLITACHILLGSVDCWAGSRSRPQVLKTDVTGLLKWAISSAPLPPAAVARTVLSCLPRGTCDSSRAPTACKIRLRWHIAGIVAAFRSILGWDFHFWGATRNLSLET